MSDYKTQIKTYCAAVEEYLGGCFADGSLAQHQLFDAMRYSLLAGGKRIRPTLVLEFSRICGADWKKNLPFAAAVEMVHTYSLIHDDLPCMDNDDYRRGRLTNHKIFGDAVAVLAGDGLLTAAFDTLSHTDAPADAAIAAVGVLSRAVGELGMVGGQVLDIANENVALAADEVYNIHRLKTGCLISAACRIGVIAAGGSQAQVDAAAKYADSLGLAFQIRDDMLDVLGDAGKLGKATGMDADKNTFVTLYGVKRCSELIEEETEKAISALDAFGDRAFLTELARNMAIREY